MMRALLAALVALASALPAGAADFASNAVGTVGSEFLTIDAGARGIGMGGAYSAVTNDAFSMYWNPAGLAQIPRASTVYMRTQYLADISFDYIAHAQRIGETAVLGGAFRNMDAGSIPQTDINGNDSGSFHPRSFVYEAGYGQNITDLTDFERDVAMGVTGRFFSSDMGGRSATGFAGDIGIQAHYSSAYYPYNFAAVVQNIGQGQKFDRVRDTLPFRVRLGSSLLLNPKTLASLEAIFPAAGIPIGMIGAEHAIVTETNLKFAIRGGLSSETLTSGLDGIRGFNFGMGLAVTNFSFDYAFVPMGILGNTHRLSISYNLPSKSSGRYRER
ncbi:MAG: PorV/PorQ family protein [Elusimicrobia bacterium]|nr:PorV/PorQ family protein [Elusimicrobiota bacterium]